MPIQRKYDFKAGTRISSSQIDEEFDQLVNSANTLEEKTTNLSNDKLPHTGTTTDLNMNGKNIGEVGILALNDANSDGFVFHEYEAANDGKRKVASFNQTTKSMHKMVKEESVEGVVSFPNQPYVSASRVGSTTSLVTGVWTKIDFTTEYNDVGGNFDLTNDRFNAPEGGLYLLNGYFDFNAQPTGLVNLRIMKDGVILTTMRVARYEMTQSFIRQIQLDKGSYYEFYMMLEGPTTLTLNSFNLNISKIS